LEASKTILAGTEEKKGLSELFLLPYVQSTFAGTIDGIGRALQILNELGLRE
jgi:hypothetical protein